MASFLVPSRLGTPGPGGPSTPSLSNQDHFWKPASLPANSICRSLGTALEKGEHQELYKMGGRPGASLGVRHRCAPFKPRSHRLGDSILSSSLFLGWPGRKKP